MHSRSDSEGDEIFLNPDFWILLSENWFSENAQDSKA
jgi:hypothetical protein